MKLSFPRGELSLESNEQGVYVLQMKGEILAKFKQMKRAVTEYNKIRLKLESELPPSETSDGDKQQLFKQHLADSLVGHNSYRPPAKKAAKSRTFG